VNKNSKVIYKGKIDYELITKLSLVDWVESVSFSGVMEGGKPDFGHTRHAVVCLQGVKTVQGYLNARAKIFEVMGEKFRHIIPNLNCICVEYGDVYSLLYFYIPASVELMSEIFGCKLEVKSQQMSYNTVSCSVGGGY
jgi:hypothetical protein